MLWHAFLLLLTVSSLSVRATTLGVAGRDLQAAFDGGNGDLLSLTDPISGYSYLAQRCPLFQIQLSRADGTSEWKDSRSAQRFAVRAQGRHQFTLTFRSLAPGVDATVEVRNSSSGGLRFRITIGNHSERIIEQIVFPLLRLKRPLGDSAEDDRLFVPGGDGYVATAEAMQRQKWQRRSYPGHASMQFTAYYDDLHGVSLRCEDTESKPKLIGASVGDNFLDLSPWFNCPFVPQVGYVSPWVDVGRVRASWTAAAMQYRRWARRQWWARAKGSDRATPQWLLDSPLVLSADFRPLGNGRMFVPLEKVTRFARLWQCALGANSILVEWRNWERHGYYTSPFYFPLYPSPDKAAQVLSDLHRAGYHSQAMVAGLKWMVYREPFHTPHYNVPGYDGREAFEERGRAVCVVARDGQAQVDQAYFTWDGDHAYMCPSTQFAKEHFRNTARILAQAGFDLFEFDQMNGGWCPPCYSTAHGHPPGYGTWTRRAIAELMEIVRAEGRRHNPDFAISMEDPGELFLPHLDTYISRVNDVIGWPAVGPGSEVVPAFSFVYGDLIQSTNVDLQHTTRPDDYVLLRTARAFIYGAGLSTQLTPWQVLADYGEENLFPSPDKMNRDQLTLLRNIVRTHDGPLRPYLSRGQMLLTGVLGDVPSVAIRAQHQVGDRREDVTISSPAILTNCWALSDRQVDAYVNLTNSPLTVPTDDEETVASTNLRSTIYMNGEPVHDKLNPRLHVPALGTLVVETTLAR